MGTSEVEGSKTGALAGGSPTGVALVGLGVLPGIVSSVEALGAPLFPGAEFPGAEFPGAEFPGAEGEVPFPGLASGDTGEDVLLPPELPLPIAGLGLPSLLMGS